MWRAGFGVDVVVVVVVVVRRVCDMA